MKLALVFPGQASQFVGMGRLLSEAYPSVRDLYRRTDEILDAPISRLSFEGPDDELVRTENTQPAIFALSVALWQLLDERGVRPVVVAGHSLGEYAALVAAGVFSYEQALPVVRLRGRLMQEAGRRRPGTMAAVIGLDGEALAGVCRRASDAGLVQVANLNSPGQVVISGEIEGVERAMELAREAGAKRVVRLSVSGAFHSPLMEYARRPLAEALERMTMKEPRVPVVANVTARPVDTADGIPDLLDRQLISPVRWSESVTRMARMGAEHFLEVGPGKVLQGLIRRIVPGTGTSGVSDPDSLQTFFDQQAA
jgi:[acyl-carrier-protein] S-malonyltransferase